MVNDVMNLIIKNALKIKSVTFTVSKIDDNFKIANYVIR